jgi:hypothetical protein
VLFAGDAMDVAFMA